MDMGVPPEQEKEFGEYCRHFVNSETKQQKNKTEELENRIQELLDENAKLKKHKGILEKTTLNRQSTIANLQDEIEQLKQEVEKWDLIESYEKFLLYIKAIDFSHDNVTFYFENDTDCYQFLRSLTNVLIKIKKDPEC